MITLSTDADGRLIQEVMGDPVADISRGKDARFSYDGDVYALMATSSTRFKGHQTNASFISGDTIWKFFHTLEAGVHPDVEITRSLHRHVAGYLGHFSFNGYTTAIVSRLLPNAHDCWQLRTELAPHAEQLGVVLREVHDDLAAAFPTELRSSGDLLNQLTHRLETFCSRTPQVEQFRDVALAAYHDLPSSVTVQRIHGDVHLGQILLSEGEFYLIDFEGEPTVSLQQRRQPDSRLRDVAGMLRSFDYAQVPLDANFLRGYGPLTEDEHALLQAYVVDKLMYEIDYEAHHRRDWLAIPLRAAHAL